jgi:hypothetical protein
MLRCNWLWVCLCGGLIGNSQHSAHAAPDGFSAANFAHKYQRIGQHGLRIIVKSFCSYLRAFLAFRAETSSTVRRSKMATWDRFLSAAQRGDWHHRPPVGVSSLSHLHQSKPPTIEWKEPHPRTIRDRLALNWSHADNIPTSCRWMQRIFQRAAIRLVECGVHEMDTCRASTVPNNGPVPNQHKT